MTGRDPDGFQTSDPDQSQKHHFSWVDHQVMYFLINSQGRSLQLRHGCMSSQKALSGRMIGNEGHVHMKEMQGTWAANGSDWSLNQRRLFMPIGHCTARLLVW